MTVWTAFFSVLSFIAVAAPFLPGRGSAGEPATEPEPSVPERVRQVRWAMEELELDAASGKIGAADRDALRAELEDELGRALRRAPSSGGDADGGVPRG